MWPEIELATSNAVASNFQPQCLPNVREKPPKGVEEHTFADGNTCPEFEAAPAAELADGHLESSHRYAQQDQHGSVREQEARCECKKGRVASDCRPHHGLSKDVKDGQVYSLVIDWARGTGCPVYSASIYTFHTKRQNQAYRQRKMYAY
ncbi:hypothetical protein HPB48_006390 [Haemaphysalis longicornis]|uniref:Uncharacterized protein n=1 Tax=Haemaphysalis longicornis TaxID=44386 RepID=A0A9J6FMQ1_HAELO|nr:hypothetical protein HPB48_006390 [Haemaphysalis longicornis]